MKYPRSTRFSALSILLGRRRNARARNHNAHLRASRLSARWFCRGGYIRDLQIFCRAGSREQWRSGCRTSCGCSLLLHVFFTILLTVFFRSSGLTALRIMIGSVYFWGGFHKFNMSFYHWIFPWFVSSFYTYSPVPSVFGVFMKGLLYTVPAFESAIGILLLFVPVCDCSRR